MKKNYLLLLLLLPFAVFPQGITVSTTSYTPTQLVNDIFFGSNCITTSNITASSPCGVGYFNANGGSFPFAEGIILRSGLAATTAGSYAGTNISTVCSGQADADLQQIITSYGLPGSITDASFIAFDFTAQTASINFDFLFASQEYGQYQCAYSDHLAFILTDLSTLSIINLAVVPNTNTPVSVNSVRSNTANANCTSVNETYFGSYNVANPATSAINMRGQTTPMTASGTLIPGHNYSLKIVIGDYNDSSFDSAVFIEAGSYFPYQCGETIEMVAFFDANSNGIKDPEEINFKHGSFKHQINNTGEVVNNYSPNGNVFIGTTNTTATYDLNYSIDADFAPYFSNATSFNDITIVEDSGINTFYFPLINTQTYNDLAVSLISTNQPQPGFDYHQTILVTNNGVMPSSGTLSFTKDALISITSISQSGTTTTPTGFTYDFTNLLPGESLSFQVTTLIPTIPTVALGDYLNNTAAVTTTDTEVNLNNNTDTLTEIIIGSYDPNDKMESHGAEIPFQSFDNDDYLEYTIRFQNTGTFYATKVRIEDQLEAQLDPTSFQMLHASHPYTLTRVNNQLVWTFDNIQLPSTAQNEAASHGYVHFRIKPNAGFEIGDIITNQASIFFDFNPAIITNAFATEFTTTLSTPDFNDNSVVVYPNPTRTTATITSNNGTIESLKITDITGKVIRTMNVNSNTISINVSDLSTGIYLLELKNSKQEHIVKKLIIN